MVVAHAAAELNFGPFNSGDLIRTCQLICAVAQLLRGDAGEPVGAVIDHEALGLAVSMGDLDSVRNEPERQAFRRFGNVVERHRKARALQIDRMRLEDETAIGEIEPAAASLAIEEMIGEALVGDGLAGLQRNRHRAGDTLRAEEKLDEDTEENAGDGGEDEQFAEARMRMRRHDHAHHAEKDAEDEARDERDFPALLRCLLMVCHGPSRSLNDLACLFDGQMHASGTCPC